MKLTFFARIPYYLAACLLASHATTSQATITQAKTSLENTAPKTSVATQKHQQASIPLKYIKQDIDFLASDAMKGRQVFTKEIDRAASYIAARFKQANLKPFKGSYRQRFDIYHIVPKQLAVTINGTAIDQDKLTLATTAAQLSWTQNSKVEVHVVTKAQDLRQVLTEINHQGGDHLVVVHHRHEAMFKRYQAYFAKGLTKLDNAPTGTIVMALDNNAHIKEFSASASAAITTKSLSNVVGVLPGKAIPEEVVLFTAHYDHIGTKLVQAEQVHVKHKKDKQRNGETHNNAQELPDVIYNGADDNASGVAGVLNLARYFAKANNNDRTLIFVAFTAEEIGGFGSKKFAQQLPADNVTAMINMEMIGKASKFGEGQLWMTGYERSNLAEVMNKAIADKSQYIKADPYPAQQLFYRSDNATFARLGVPAHSFSSVQLDKDLHYHAVSDEAPTLNLTSLQQVLQTVAKGSVPLVSGKATPRRVDTSQVRTSGKIY